MFRRSTWMSKGYISQAVRLLEVVKNDKSRSKNERDGAEEGIACLTNAKPEYLCNLIDTNHPDRVMAMHLLTTEHRSGSK